VIEKELSSMDAPALTRRADELFAQGHTGVAASYYRRALELDPDYAPALVGIGRGILRAEKYADAMENATRALQHARGVDARPGLEAEAIYQMARVHLHQGELDAARRLFRQSISLPGTPSAAWFYLGEALWTDNSPAAREAYQRYLELVPTGHLADRARRAIR
jgi:tetratricopeptide (TPR) repeat protein